MPKKSQGSKSKRMTLKQKYKIKKKVKEHAKKKKKEMKKLGIKPKAPKDPGLPAQWPFKEELIKEFAFQRAQILADEKRRKDEKKARRAVSEGAAGGRTGVAALGGVGFGVCMALWPRPLHAAKHGHAAARRMHGMLEGKGSEATAWRWNGLVMCVTARQRCAATAALAAAVAAAAQPHCCFA